MRVVGIEGFDLPGGRFCDRDGEPFDGVHVGVQVEREACDLVSGDAKSSRWELSIRVVADDDGGLDFRGPAVHGKRGDRFLYVTWGRVDGDTFEMFRQAKLMLNTIDPEVVAAAEWGRQSLVARVRLTDACGGPRCARVDPPDVVWSTNTGRLLDDTQPGTRHR